MNREKDRVPAFPSQSGYDFRRERVTTTSEGMTLRDYFAAKALPEAYKAVRNNTGGWLGVAEAAYHIADAMLEAREK